MQKSSNSLFFGWWLVLLCASALLIFSGFSWPFGKGQGTRKVASSKEQGSKTTSESASVSTPARRSSSGGIHDPQSTSDESWYPFTLAEKMDPDSPMNIGKLVLDPPAGKHGFLKTKGNQFVFEDGTPARFWGTNLVMGACFPSHKDAEMMADRLAFFGFNAVRLAHLDFYFEPRGIFEDIAPAYKDPQMKPTTRLSEKQLEKLDYLIYQLKKRGIYIDIILLCARHFTEADGVKDATQLGMAAKPVSMFDPKLIELQKQYAKTLLTHKNKYTGLEYRDDPAIAFVEITNENSLVKQYESGKLAILPDYYKNRLEQKRQEWFKEKGTKIGTPEDLKNFYMDLQTKYFDEITRFLKSDLDVHSPITGIGGFQKWADIKTQKSCDYFDFHKYWDHPTFPENAWDQNNFMIRNNSVFGSNGLGIVDSLTKTNPGTKPFVISEWNHCYPNEFAYESPLLLASTAVKENWSALFQFAFKHGPPSHTEMRYNYFDIMANPQQLLLHQISSVMINQRYLAIPSPDLQNVAITQTELLEGAVGYIAGKEINLNQTSFKSDRNGAVLFFSADMTPLKTSKTIILITLGQVKNKNSYWSSENKFHWGDTEILLQKISLQLSLKRKNKLTIYRLNNVGFKSNKIGEISENGKTVISAESPWFELIEESSSDL
jgi:hypothetical protein